VSEIRLVLNRTWKSAKGEKRQESTFVDATTWARTAEIAVQYLKKGRLVGVDGRLTLDEWDGNDGRKHSRLHVTVDRLTLLPSGDAADRRASPPEAEEAPPGGAAEEAPAAIPA
jgi:single-strand DNA-binding protein